MECVCGVKLGKNLPAHSNKLGITMNRSQYFQLTVAYMTLHERSKGDFLFAVHTTHSLCAYKRASFFCVLQYNINLSQLTVTYC